MVRRASPGTPQAAIRGGLLVLLASISLPAIAASGINLKCDDAPAQPADLTAATAVSAEPAGDHQPLTVLKAEGDVRGLPPLGRPPVSDIGGMLEAGFDGEAAMSPVEQQELRSSALADALERRRQGRLESNSEDIEAPVPAPAVDTALPGVGDTESLLYRREMYRTDI